MTPSLADTRIGFALAPLRCFENRSCAAADRRPNQRALLASDDAADTGAAGGRSSDDHCGLTPRAVVAHVVVVNLTARSGRGILCRASRRRRGCASRVADACVV